MTYKDRAQYAAVLGLIILAGLTLALATICYVSRGDVPEFLSGFGIGALASLGTMYQLNKSDPSIPLLPIANPPPIPIQPILSELPENTSYQEVTQ